MSNPVSTIQSLKAVDAWIDVINANINGGVRTAFKSARLRFAGSNTQLDRAPTSTTLPLQLPEPSLITANTVIDFSPGAITASTENTHFAIQGHPSRFFMVVNRDECLLGVGPIPNDGAAGNNLYTPRSPTNHGGIYLTRDGEFHWGALEDLGDGVLAYYLKDSYGNYVVRATTDTNTANGTSLFTANTAPGVSNSEVVRWRGVGTDPPTSPPPPIDANSPITIIPGVVDITQPQNLSFSRFGSTTFICPPGQLNNSDRVWTVPTNNSRAYNGFLDGSVLTHALEASNSSMTQSVPELSLAQKLFSALTKVLQIHQTNLDATLNLIR